MARRAALAEALDALEAEAVDVIAAALEPVLARIIDSALAELAPVTASAAFDTLTDVLDAWGVAVDRQVLEFFAETYRAGGLAAVGRLIELGITPGTGRYPMGPAGVSFGVPISVDQYMDEAAARHLALARPRFVEIGEVAWGHARQQMLLGFEQGQSIDWIEREMRKVADLTRAVARQVARTQVVAAANAGSVKRMELEGDNGAKYKQWLSTLDSRTRPTHVTADGQVAEREAPFLVGGMAMQYPGDPAGGQAETINCRCTILWTDNPDGDLEGVEGRQEGGVLADLEDTVELPPPFPGAMRPSQAEEWMTANWAIDEFTPRYFSFHAMDSADATEFAETLDRLFRDFPQVAPRIKAFGNWDDVQRWVGTEVDVPETAYAYGHRNHIGINPTWTANNNFHQALQMNQATGHHQIGAGTVRAIVEHEYGHMVHQHAIAKLLETDINGDVTLGNEIDAAIKQVFLNDSPAQRGRPWTMAERDWLIRNQLSKYAASDMNELMAEAFSNVRTMGDEASPLGKALYAVLVRHL